MRVLQLVAEARAADAVTAQALWIGKALTELGHEHVLAAGLADPELGSRTASAAERLQEPWDLILDHYSIGTDYHRQLVRRAGRRWLVYHNITPAPLLAPWAPEIAARCDEGRRQLSSMLRYCELVLADSHFNGAEVEAVREAAGRGGPDVEVLPICVEPPEAANQPPLASLRRIWGSRGPLLLFVGRVAPQKNHLALLRVLRQLRQSDFPAAELLIVGDARGFEPYAHALREAAARMGLARAVHWLGKVAERELWSYYRLADLFCCLSLHEGFCVPLVEAFAAGLPVVAAAGGAVPETAGDAALVFGPGEIDGAAELCRAVLQSPALAETLARRGRIRAASFSYSALRSQLTRILQSPRSESEDPAASAELLARM